MVMTISVTLPYDPEWRAAIWAKQYCPSYIDNDAVRPLIAGELISVAGGWVRKYSIEYFFNDEQDAVAFALRWA